MHCTWTLCILGRFRSVQRKQFNWSGIDRNCWRHLLNTAKLPPRTTYDYLVTSLLETGDHQNALKSLDLRPDDRIYHAWPGVFSRTDSCWSFWGISCYYCHYCYYYRIMYTVITIIIITVMMMIIIITIIMFDYNYFSDMLFSSIPTANQSNDTQWRAGDVWGCHVHGNARGTLSSFQILSHIHIYIYVGSTLCIHFIWKLCARVHELWIKTDVTYADVCRLLVMQ